MRTANIEERHDKLESTMKGYRALVEEVMSPNSPYKGEVKVYLVEMIIIRMVWEFENFLYALLVACMNNNVARGYPNMKSCKADILKGQSYFKYKNAEALVEISQELLSDECNPFPVMAAYHDRLVELTKVRNYCAHHSENSREILLKVYESYQYKRWIALEIFLLGNRAERLLGYIDMLTNISLEMREEYGKPV